MFLTKPGDIVVMTGDDTRCRALAHLIALHGSVFVTNDIDIAVRQLARQPNGVAVVLAVAHDFGPQGDRSHILRVWSVAVDVSDGRWRLGVSRHQTTPHTGALTDE